jgi:uncharacterized RDD family membrane protein YckC
MVTCESSVAGIEEKVAMNLYYADGERKIGPVSKTELQALIRSRKVNAGTLVWRPGMTDWVELGRLVRKRKNDTPPLHDEAADDLRQACSECGRMFSRENMLFLRDNWVCAGCKPIVIQKMKEGVVLNGQMPYAGFWIRSAAIGIDGLILWLANLIVFIPIGILSPFNEENPMAMMSYLPLIMLLQYAIPAGYDTWFVGKYGATPGKMACKLKVVTPDGSPVSYGRAIGRHFAKWISSMILAIGFIMAAFDDQKRTLHDRICDTRVIRN